MGLATEELPRTLSLTESLPDSVSSALSSIAIREKFRAGTRLFREGTTHPGFSVLISGHVVLEMHVPGRGDVRILSLGTGDILAWSALLAEARMTCTAVAVSDVELLTFRGPDLKSLCEADHEVGYHIMSRVAKSLSQRLLATRLQLLDLFAVQSPVINPAPRARQAATTAAAEERP